MEEVEEAEEEDDTPLPVNWTPRESYFMDVISETRYPMLTARAVLVADWKTLSCGERSHDCRMVL